MVIVQELVISDNPPSKKTTTMEPKIWEKFPEELFESVCVRLPITSFFRFLSVSRKWNSLLTSPTFKKQCDGVPKTQPWIYTITYKDGNVGAMYDPSSIKWHHPRILSLPGNSIIIPLASVGGLVFLADINYTDFYVSNPVTQTVKELPSKSFFTMFHIAAGMHFNIVDGMPFNIAAGMTLNGKSTAEGYKILCVSSLGDYAIFDSITNSWDISRATPPSITLPIVPPRLSYRTETISVEGCIYFYRLYPEGMVSYNMVSGVWKEFVIPAPHPFVVDQVLAECGGRILLVGMIISDLSLAGCVGVGVWELEKMTFLWKEVDTIPYECFFEFFGKATRMICLGNKDLILLLLKSSQENVNRFVSYDVLKKEWSNVPESILPRGRLLEHDCLPYGTTFYPCITAAT